MKMILEKLGILFRAEIDLGEFTLICGKNNTGKTYASYALYGFLRSWHRFNSGILTQEQEDILLKNGSVDIDLQKNVLSRWPEILEHLGKQYTRLLPAVLAADTERFKNTQISFDLPIPEEKFKRSFERVLRIKDKEPLFSLSKQDNSLVLKISLLKLQQPSDSAITIKELVIPALEEYCFGHLLPNVFMASTERTGAAIFQNELNFSRTRLIEALASLERSKKLTPEDILPAIIPEFRPRYAFPVRDSVDFVNQLDSITGSESELIKEHRHILDRFHDILGGEYRIVRKVVYFVPSKSGGMRLNLGESSSAVRSLLDVGFYLRHLASKGDLLMIDEPELNLHPANQRKVARLLASLVNVGIRVFVTTHSDYIAKELNTLLLLGQAGKEVVSKYKYKDSELLKPEQVHLYIADEELMKRDDSTRRSYENTLRRIKPLDDGGFEFPSFDDTIEEMNRIQREIWDSLDIKVERKHA